MKAYALHSKFGKRTNTGMTLHIFETRALRDAWVAKDEFDNGWHRFSALRKEDEVRVITCGSESATWFEHQMDGAMTFVERDGYALHKTPWSEEEGEIGPTISTLIN